MRGGSLMLVAGLIGLVGCKKKVEGPDPDPRQFQLELLSGEGDEPAVHTQYPNYINMIVRVTDGRITQPGPDGQPVPGVSNPDYYVVGLKPQDPDGKGHFSVLENGETVQVEAGLRVASLEDSLRLQVNLLLDVSGSVGEAGLIRAKNASKRMVARPCGPNEIARNDKRCFPYVYQDLDEASGEIVTKEELWRSVLKENETVQLYAFSDTVRPVPLRELDAKGERYPSKTRRILDTLDQDIQLGVDSTNLYGALLRGLEDLKATRSLDNPVKGIEDGLVILFTDGSHTSGNLTHEGQTFTPSQAIARIRELRGDLGELDALPVITIALESPALRETIPDGEMKGGGVKELQNAGYLRVDNYKGLNARFDEAFELVDRYARSLYRVYYRTPKTGSQRVDLELQVTCPRCLKNDAGEPPEEARLRQSIETRSFYQAVPGVYIEDPILAADGTPARATHGDKALTGLERITLAPHPDRDLRGEDAYEMVLANHPYQQVRNPARAELLRLHTYVRASDDRTSPSYAVASSDESVLKVRGVARLTPIESVALVECLVPGIATFTATDEANGGLSRTITVDCAE